jgi:hypothetical protein
MLFEKRVEESCLPCNRRRPTQRAQMKWEVKGSRRTEKEIGMQGSEKIATPPQHFHEAV